MTNLTTTTADKLRAEAAQCESDKQESFERCDTDGFISQWASGITAQQKRLQADIVERGYESTFVGLYEGDRRVKAKVGHGQWGFYWLLHEDEADIIRPRRGKPFLPTGTHSRVLKSLGLAERQESAPARAEVVDSGSGLSGCHVASVRMGDHWGQDATLGYSEDPR